MLILRNLTVGRKLALGFGLQIFFVVAICLTGFSGFSGAERSGARLSEIGSLYDQGGVLKDSITRSFSQGSDLSEPKKELDNLTGLVQGVQKKISTGKWPATYAPIADKVMTDIEELKRSLQNIPSGDKSVTVDAFQSKITGLLEDINVIYGAEEKYSAEILSFNRWLLGCLGIGALLIGVLVAIFIYRQTVPLLKDVLSLARRITEGDLTGRLDSSRNDELGELVHAVSNMQSSLYSIVEGLKKRSSEIVTAAQEITAGNTELSARTEEQATSVEETAATLGQLSGTVSQTTENITQVHHLVSDAGGIVRQNGELMKSVTRRMQGIHDSSAKMAEIIQVIDGIAFQTNILALNAAVEAARAGESGRGFAVVANEVRTLAGRSATAAKEIRELIDNSVSQIQEGRGLVERADSASQDMVHNVTNMTQLMNEIAHASSEQNDGLGQISTTMSHIDDATQQNATLVEQSVAVAASMNNLAQELMAMVGVFRLGNEVRNVKAQEDVPATRQRDTVAIPATAGRKVVNAERSAQSGNDNWETF